MTLLDVEPATKKFEPGTTGWTAADLDDSAVERQWFAGRYEIIEGVLTVMAAAYFSGGEAPYNLTDLIKDHLKATTGRRSGFASEVDIVIDARRVLRADVAYLDLAAKARQRAAAIADGRRDLRRTRILVPPTLVIESVSPGHEAHDRVTKRKWYAEFGVPHYWVLDAFGRSLECLTLDGGTYRPDAVGGGEDVLRPTAFAGLVISLAEVWEE